MTIRYRYLRLGMAGFDGSEIGIYWVGSKQAWRSGRVFGRWVSTLMTGAAGLHIWRVGGGCRDGDGASF